MKIESNVRKSNCLLSWADVDVTDNGQERQVVKSINLKIDAGDLAILEVETYGIPESNGALNISINSHGGPVTSTRKYFVDKILIEAKTIEQLKEDKKGNRDEEMLRLKRERISNINPISELEL